MVSRRGLLLCLAAAVLFGASTPAASRLVRDLNPFTLAGLLYLGAALGVCPIAWLSRPDAGVVRRAGRRLGLAVVCGGVIGPVLLAVGLRDVPASTASLLLNLELVFTALIAVVVFKEHLGRRLTVGIALVVAAGVLLGWSSDVGWRWAALLIGGACLCWAVDNSVTAKLDQIAPAQITFVKGAVAGFVNVMIGLLGGGMLTRWLVVAALAVGALGYGVSMTLWIAGARELGAARGQLVFAAAPFVGALVSWFVHAHGHLPDVHHRHEHRE